jgi:hypothetical protein
MTVVRNLGRWEYSVSTAYSHALRISEIWFSMQFVLRSFKGELVAI